MVHGHLIVGTYMYLEYYDINTGVFYLKTADISCIVIRSLSAHSAHQSQAVVTLPLSSSISAAVCDSAASHTSSFVAATRNCDHKSTSGTRFMCQSASTRRGSMPFIEHSCTVEITKGTQTVKFDSLSTNKNRQRYS